MPDLQRIVKMYPLIFNIFLCLRCSLGLANRICLVRITIPAGLSRSVKNVADTKLLLRGACKKQVPTFFKARLHSNAQKASSRTGISELQPPLFRLAAGRSLCGRLEKEPASVL